MPGRRQHGEGSLYRRTRGGQWVAVADLGWRAGKRDRREFTGPDAETALRKRAAFLARREGGFTLPRGRQPTVAEWVLHWCYNVARPRVDPNTWYRSYRQRCEDYIAPYFDRVKLADVTEDDIETWHRWLEGRTSRRGTPLAPGTIATAHRILSAALNTAVARRRLPHNPATFVPPPKVPRPAIEPPSEGEVRAVLRACRGRPDGARWVLAITTGLRQGEALGLRWRDVRLDPPAAVTVRQALARTSGQAVFKPPKSAKSRRTVPLPAVAVEALRTHRAAQQVASLDGLVFVRKDGGPVHYRTELTAWHRLLGELGLPRYRIHDLRHGYATMLLEAGADPRLVQDLLGHSSTALLQVYQHVRPVMHEQAVGMLDQLLNGG